MRQLKKMTRETRQAILHTASSGLNLIFPEACPRCGRPVPTHDFRSELCDACREPLQLPLESMCPCCASLIHRLTVRDGRCPYCRNERPCFQKIVCLGPYSGELGKTVVQMKQLTEQPLAYAVGRLLAQRAVVALQDDLPQVLVPMPMHWRRRLRRGTNTAEVLAEALGRTLSIPVRARALRSVRLTEKQSTLTPAQRRRNVRNAFALKRSLVPSAGNWRGLHVGLVDDTVTTGATSNSASRVLLDAGTARVTVLAVARASR